MTTQDRAFEAAAEQAPPAFFIADGDTYVPTRLAQGPWGASISGNYVGGILGRTIERDAGDPDLQPARLTVDLLRRAALAPLRIQTSVQREGRRIRLVDAVMTQDDRTVARASALFLRRGEQPADSIWTSPVAMPAPPTEPADVADDAPMRLWVYGKDPQLATPAIDLSEWQHAGPKYAWVRDITPLVDGEPLTPFTRAAMAGDMASSVTHFGAGGLHFINADYTLTLSRLPDGPYIGLASLTHYSHAGVATGVATILDRRGAIGSAVANALVNPGFEPPASLGAALG
jgi:acyl-coenzyme A thioesterase PaaI-like protein